LDAISSTAEFKSFIEKKKCCPNIGQKYSETITDFEFSIKKWICGDFNQLDPTRLFGYLSSRNPTRTLE